MQDVWSKLARWSIFTVVLSLFPIILDYVLKAAVRSDTPLNEVIAKGELSLICTALSGVAVGELLGISEKAKLFKICLGGVCFLNAVFSICLYIAMKAAEGSLGSLYLDRLSWWLFFETAITSTIAIAVSEAKK